jgi:2-phosphosulfolactate phosphatase
MAREVRDSLPQTILAGEVDAVPPPDFDHGNSPAEWGALDVAGREVLFSTTNGARGLHAAMGGGPVFAGSLRNASAVCADALAAARRLMTTQAPGGVTVVCSGLGGQPALDDSLCAGWLIQTLQRAAAQAGVPAELGAGAQRALDLLADQRTAYGGADDDAQAWLAEALAVTPAARAVVAAGLGADIAWCADVDASTAVPQVAGEDVSRTLEVVEKAPSDGSDIPDAEAL